MMSHQKVGSLNLTSLSYLLFHYIQASFVCNPDNMPESMPNISEVSTAKVKFTNSFGTKLHMISMILELDAKKTIPDRCTEIFKTLLTVRPRVKYPLDENSACT